MTATSEQIINGIDTGTARQLIRDVARDATNGSARFSVATRWNGGTRSVTRIEQWELGGRSLARDFAIQADEPAELLGSGAAPNPMELLMAAFNACLLASYVVGCAMEGVRLEDLSIQTEGQLDLRGFLGLDVAVPPGFDQLRCTVRLRANGTAEQLRKIHQTVLATSPNRWNLANAVQLHTELLVTANEPVENSNSKP